MSKLFAIIEGTDEQSPGYTFTENGALTLKSSGKALVDLFSRGGAMRHASNEDIIQLFDNAYNEEPGLAIAILFYLRDVRGGQGERRFFRTVLSHLSSHQPDLTKALLPLVPEYGRWDDIFALRGTDEYVYRAALYMLKNQLLADLEALNKDDKAQISLAAKWAPSEKAGKKSKALAFDVMRAMDYTPKAYRRLLSKLRSHLDVVERKMCAKQFSQIRYDAVPSRAAMLYRNAFRKNDCERYQAYLQKVAESKSKINASTLYPYEIVNRLRELCSPITDETLELQWKALPDYPVNGLAVVDVSGSMTWTSVSSGVYPIDVALALGIYMAERNTSIFKDKLITFSEHPEFFTLKGDSLYERLVNMQSMKVGGSTNIQGVFDIILAMAQQYSLPPEEMPSVIYIFSDMEFNIPGNNSSSAYKIEVQGFTNLQAITKKYEQAGYIRPNVVFWNVQSRTAQSPAAYDDNGVALFSGCSPTLFSIALTGDLNPLKAMLTMLENERYNAVINLVNDYIDTINYGNRLF